MSTITQTIAQMDKIEMLCKLSQIVSKGNYYTGDWWTVDSDDDTGEDVYSACPLSRLQFWCLSDFETDELCGDVYWYDPETPWQHLRHPSPREVAHKMFSGRFLHTFLDCIDSGQKAAALEAIQKEIGRLQRKNINLKLPSVTDLHVPLLAAEEPVFHPCDASMPAFAGETRIVDNDGEPLRDGAGRAPSGCPDRLPASPPINLLLEERLTPPNH